MSWADKIDAAEALRFAADWLENPPMKATHWGCEPVEVECCCNGCDMSYQATHAAVKAFRAEADRLEAEAKK